jgi:predicted GIY-YIG superfamily endonuclease
MSDSKQAHELYILHFSSKVADHAQHYVGITSIGIDNRFATHLDGRGAKLVASAVKRGLTVVIAHREIGFATPQEARYREKRLKLEKNLKRHCEICNGKK